MSLELQDFIDAGFGMVHAGDPREQYRSQFLQKTVKDDSGIRYIINIKVTSKIGGKTHWIGEVKFGPRLSNDFECLTFHYEIGDISSMLDRIDKHWKFCGEEYYD